MIEAEKEREMDYIAEMKADLKVRQIEVMCQFCGKYEGTESITDGETLQEVMICVGCDDDVNWKPSNEQERLIQAKELK